MRAAVALAVVLLVQLSQSFRMPASSLGSLPRGAPHPPPPPRHLRLQLGLRRTVRGGCTGAAVAAAGRGGQGCAERVSSRVSAGAGDADALFAAAVAIYEQAVREGGEPSAESLIAGLQALEEVFRLDFEEARVTQYEAADSRRSLMNVTCMRPARSAPAAAGHEMRDGALRALALEPGRICSDGRCCDACSRVLLPRLASDAECLQLVQHAAAFLPSPDIGEQGGGALSRNLPLEATAAIGNVELHLLYIRLIERVRRCIAHEYGVELLHLSPRQSFINRLHHSLSPAGHVCMVPSLRACPRARLPIRHAGLRASRVLARFPANNASDECCRLLEPARRRVLGQRGVPLHEHSLLVGPLRLYRRRSRL